jgi:hypothetical protein
MDPYLFLLLYFASVLHFFYIVYEVCSSPLYSDFSGWKRYEVLFALWLNSGSVEIHCFSWVQLFLGDFAVKFGKLEQIEGKHNVFQLIAAPLSALVDDKFATKAHLIPVFLLPILITHIVSSVIIFIPLFLVIFVIYFGLILWWFFKSGQVEVQFGKFKLFSLLLIFRVIPSFLFLILFQTFTNFSIMFYSGDFAYL